MSDPRPTLTLPDGTPLGKVTDFRAGVAVTGDVHILEALKPCDVFPSKGTFEISASIPMGVFDPFEKTQGSNPPRPNRKQRRKQR